MSMRRRRAPRADTATVVYYARDIDVHAHAGIAFRHYHSEAEMAAATPEA